MSDGGEISREEARAFFHNAFVIASRLPGIEQDVELMQTLKRYAEALLSVPMMHVAEGLISLPELRLILAASLLYIHDLESFVAGNPDRDPARVRERYRDGKIR